MKKSAIAAVFGATMLVASPASAADVDGYYVLLGEGVGSCGKFLGKVDKYKQTKSDWYEYTWYFSWVSGYLTAYNRYIPDTYDIRDSTDAAGIRAFVEKYCQENPLKDYLDAINALIAELYPNRKRKAD